MVDESIPLSPSFANLTSVCFNQVCDQLSLADLLSCGGVNQHWRTLTLDYTRARMRALEILTKKDGWMPMYPYTAFSILPKRNQKSAIFLNSSPQERFSLLPDDLEDGTESSAFCLSLAQGLTHYCSPTHRLTSLTIQLRCLTDATLEGLSHLLAYCSGTLLTLRLAVYAYRTSEHLYSMQWGLKRIFSSINKLDNLKRLSLRFHNHPLNMSPHLRALSWIHELEFTCEDTTDVLYDSLCRYAAENARLHTINYETGNLETPWVALQRYTQTESGRAAASHFAIFNYSKRKGQLHNFPTPIERHFPALTFLKLELFYEEWHHVLADLARGLPRLSELVLLTYPRNSLTNEELYDEFPAEQLLQLPRFTQVRNLILEIECSTDHIDVEQFDLPHFFPHLEMFALEYPELSCNRVSACKRCLIGDGVAAQRRAKSRWWQMSSEKKEAGFLKCSSKTFHPWLQGLPESQIQTLKRAAINGKQMDI